jgi:hypothetical protein
LIFKIFIKILTIYRIASKRFSPHSDFPMQS